jgi:uncharacterized Zn-binding protein involved in type VI secretion
MRDEAGFSRQLLELVGETRAGGLDRREFLRRAGLLGLSSAATGSLTALLFSPAQAGATPARPPSNRPPPGTFQRPPAGGQQPLGDDDGPAQRGGDSAGPASGSTYDDPPAEQGDLGDLGRSRAVLQEPELKVAAGSYRFGTVQPAEGGTGLSFWLRSPYEGSPKILTQGWTMTAHVRSNLPDVDPERLAAGIRWDGSGTFASVGPNATPTFARAGQNQVRLSVNVRGRVYSSTFHFLAKDADQYARLGARSQCHADAHGCPACPHPVVGPVIVGSPTFLVGGKPLARVGDQGIHAACCGPNTFTVVDGDPEILVDGKRVPRLHDRTRHCGGEGQLVSVA